MDKKTRFIMGLFSIAAIMLPKDGNIEAQSMGDVVSNYQSFMSSPVKGILEDYLREDEEHSFEGMGQNQDGIVLEDEVNFRMGPGTTYDIIRTFNADEHLEVLGVCDRDWYLVRSKGTIGFIYGEYLRVVSPEFKESQKLEFRPTFLCGVEAVSGANVRKSPDVKTGVIVGGLNAGDRLPAYERLENGWYHVNFQGEDAYIFGELVKEIYATSVDDYPMFYTMEDAPFCVEPYEESIISIPAGQTMYLLGENQDYFFTQYNNIFGYVRKSHCERLTDTYVVVDISDQEVKVYHRGEEILSTYVVTGSEETPTYLGAYYILDKAHDVILRGIDYALPVKNWVPFIKNGSGFHDASWRESFGMYYGANGEELGPIRYYAGTHGCVNMEENISLVFYDMVHVGDRVFVKE